MTLTALRVRGPYKGPSGYEHHVREFVREVGRQGVAVELIDLPEWSALKLPPALQESWLETLNRPVDARIALHFTMPHQVLSYPGMLTVNYTMFEADRVQPAWVEHNRRHDLVIVPTESSRQAWLTSGLPSEKIAICPLGIDPERYGQSVEALPLRRDNGEPVADYRVRFLNVSELGPRKNLIGLVRAWIRATNRDDDAILLLKLGSPDPSWFDVFRGQLELVQRQLGKRLEEAAPIAPVFEVYPDAAMPRLYASATHYLSLSHGEGWDLPMLEAAASGLRLIAPEHSAYTAYLDREVARLIPSRLVPADFPGGDWVGALFNGVSWWEPDEDEAVAAIRAAIAGNDTPQRSARARVLTELTWERSTRRLIELLSGLDGKTKRRAFPSLARRNRSA